MSHQVWDIVIVASLKKNIRCGESFGKFKRQACQDRLLSYDRDAKRRTKVRRGLG
jgi:hypothetical protein